MTGHYNYPGDELELFGDAKNWKRYLSAILLPHIRGRVLEVGAGVGGTTPYISTGTEEDWMCLEPDLGMARRIEERKMAGELPDLCRVCTGTVADIDEVFDTVIYIDVLEHIEKDTEELKNIERILAPKGHLIILVPAYQWLYTEFDRSIGHYRRYTKAGVVAIMPPFLKPVKALYLDSTGLLASLANRLLLRATIPQASQILFWDRVLVPISRVLDPLVARSFGRSVVVVSERI